MSILEVSLRLPEDAYGQARREHNCCCVVYTLLPDAQYHQTLD